MNIEGLSEKKIKEELGKTIKVRAKGDPQEHAGFYNNIRRRGGDIFVLRAKVRDRKFPVLDENKKQVIEQDYRVNKPVPVFKFGRAIITAEEQFSPSWMERVDERVAPTKPKHFNSVGRGNAKNALNIPGMTQRTEPDRLDDSSPVISGNDEILPGETRPEEEAVI